MLPVADYFGLPELCEKLEVVTKNNNNEDIILLDVGGTIFKIARATLTRKPDSKLAKMFTPGSETSPPLTEDGAYFIDCCPKAAESVLNCIRRSSLCDYSKWVGTCYGDIDEDLSFAAKSFGLDLTSFDLNGDPLGDGELRFRY